MHSDHSLSDRSDPHPAAGGADAGWNTIGHPTVLPHLDRSKEPPKLLVTETQRYRILRPLGAGAAGEVFLAEDHDIGRRVAIKRILAQRRSQTALLRFVREVSTIGGLEHPNIVPIHDVGQDETGDFYFVMKHVEGLTLEQLIAGLQAGDADLHRRFGIEQRLNLGRSLMEAMAFAHSKGVIHRDLKPANIMVGPYGEVSVLDWGIAKAQTSPDDLDLDGVPATPGDTGHQTRTGSIIGTPRYMSPEQAQGQPADHRSDVYSLSVLLHELLTLRHYLDGVFELGGMDTLLREVGQRPHPLASLVRHPHRQPVDMDISWFLAKGVHKDPEARYQSMTEMLEALARRDDGEILVRCPVTLAKRSTREFEKAMNRFMVPHMGWILTARPVTMVLVAALGVLAVGAMAAISVALVLGLVLALA